MAERVETLSKNKKELVPGVHNRQGCAHRETPRCLSNWLSKHLTLLDWIVFLFYLKLSTKSCTKALFLTLNHYPTSTKKEL